MKPKWKEREEARSLRLQGLSLNQIMRQVGVSKGSVSLWVRDIETPKKEGEPKEKISKTKIVPQVDWVAVQSYYDSTKSLRKCISHFHISKWLIDKALADGLLICRLRMLPLNEVLIKNSALSTGNIRKRLLSSGTKKQMCEECGITSWNGMAITFELHHINGINDDHRLENLRLLCPNCHSQTETYKGRNKIASRKRKIKVGQEEQ